MGHGLQHAYQHPVDSPQRLWEFDAGYPQFAELDLNQTSNTFTESLTLPRGKQQFKVPVPSSSGMSINKVGIYVLASIHLFNPKVQEL